MELEFWPDWRNKLTESYRALRTKNTAAPLSLNLCIGVCRSGTTALAQVFGQAGFSSYYQPAKGDVRLSLSGQTPINLANLTSTQVKSSRHFVKETLGPLNEIESDVDYIDLYKEAGFDVEKICFIITFRNPFDTYKSWLVQWGNMRSREQLFDNFILSHRRLAKTISKLGEIGRPPIFHCLELSNIGDYVFKNLFRNLDQPMEFDPRWLNWNILNHTDKNSAVIFPTEPDCFAKRHIHENSGHWGEHRPSAEKRKLITLSTSEDRLIRKENLISDYHKKAYGMYHRYLHESKKL